MKVFSRIPVEIISISLIVIVGAFSLNNLIYTHSHILEDGRVITHAHPFDKSSDTDPFKSHLHTSSELIFLANMTFYLPIFILAIISFYIISGKKFNVVAKALFQQVQGHSPPLRGPPARV